MCCKFAIYPTASIRSLVSDCLFKFRDCRFHLGFKGVIEFLFLGDFLANVGVAGVHELNKIGVESDDLINRNIC